MDVIYIRKSEIDENRSSRLCIIYGLEDLFHRKAQPRDAPEVEVPTTDNEEGKPFLSLIAHLMSF